METLAKLLDRMVTVLIFTLILGAGAIAGHYEGEATAYKQFVHAENDSVDALAKSLPPIPAMNNNWDQPKKGNKHGG